jgi:hypothetical protein
MKCGLLANGGHAAYIRIKTVDMYFYTLGVDSRQFSFWLVQKIHIKCSKFIFEKKSFTLNRGFWMGEVVSKGIEGQYLCFQHFQLWIEVKVPKEILLCFPSHVINLVPGPWYLLASYDNFWFFFVLNSAALPIIS